MNEKVTTRSPIEGESWDESLSLYNVRCQMAPNVEDLEVNSRQRLDGCFGFGTVELERATRAGVQVRTEVIERFNVKQWKSAVRALYAITYGAIDKRIVRLIRLCFRAKRKTEAEMAISGFGGANPEMGFVDSCIYDWVRDVLFPCPNKREVTMRRIAVLCGLVAENGEYELGDLPSSGWWRKGEKVDLEAVLARGVATFKKESVPALLEYWEGVAHQSGRSTPLPKCLSWDSVRQWAREVMVAAEREEGTNRPHALLSEEESSDGDLHLVWWGTFTEGRTFKVSIFFSPEGELSDMTTTARWDSATGHPSRFLEIQDLLALPGCVGFSEGESVTSE